MQSDDTSTGGIRTGISALEKGTLQEEVKEEPMSVIMKGTMEATIPLPLDLVNLIYSFGPAYVRGHVVRVYDTKLICSGLETAPKKNAFFCTDWASNSVRLFDVASGKQLNSFGRHGDGMGQLRVPEDVVYSEQKNRIFVTDQGNHRVQAFDVETGTVMALWNGCGVGTNSADAKSNFAFPKGAAFDARRGLLYVADHFAKRMKVFDQEGLLVRTWDTLYWPASVAVYRDNVFVAHPSMNCVETFTPEGTQVAVWNAHTEHIACDGAYLYCSNNTENCVQVRRALDGQLLASWEWECPCAVSLMNGRLFTSNRHDNTVCVFD